MRRSLVLWDTFCEISTGNTHGRAGEAHKGAGQDEERNGRGESIAEVADSLEDRSDDQDGGIRELVGQVTQWDVRYDAAQSEGGDEIPQGLAGAAEGLEIRPSRRKDEAACRL
ncbi:hypothetical protein FGB62_108g06 [Gracilaria domingensis]|nr:hypothetical protein FGB62_108g06 [Gracilaria domingensis]